MKTFVFLFFFLISIPSFTQEVPYTLADRDRLMVVEKELVSLRKEMNARFDAMNARFDAINTKLEAQNTKIKAQNEKLDILFTLIYFVLGGIIALIGFVLWDRRTFLKPVKDENKDLAERNKKIEQILKDYAKDQPKLADILKSYGMF